MFMLERLLSFVRERRSDKRGGIGNGSAMFNPAERTTVVFLNDTKKRCNLVRPEGYVLETIAAAVGDVPKQDNLVVLSDEYFSPFRAGDMAYPDPAPFSLLFSGMMANQKRRASMLCGRYLFQSDGTMVRLHKYHPRGSLEKSEEGPLGFRLCAALVNRPLSPLPTYYFVSAAALQDHIPSPQTQIIYINDLKNGLRRITPTADSFWIPYHDTDTVTSWNDEKHNHRVVLV
ncbi:hypothetical protein HYS47_03205 [Candidatus Woesearchaeota archaeon]|nr:hypothetical protein [Candidatus Woesearchaeota archaeon]